MKKRTPETIHTSLRRIIPQLGERAEFLERMARDVFDPQPIEGSVKSDGTVYAVLNRSGIATSLSYTPGPGGEKDTNDVISLGFAPASDRRLRIECGVRDNGAHYASAIVYSWNEGRIWEEHVDRPDLVAQLAANLVGQARDGIAQCEQDTGYTSVGERRQPSVARYALGLLNNK